MANLIRKGEQILKRWEREKKRKDKIAIAESTHTKN